MGLESLQDELSEHMSQMGAASEFGEELPQADAATPAASPKSRSPIAIQNIPLELEVILGRIGMTVAELGRVGPGQVLSLNKMIGEPIDLVVNDTKIGTAELIALEGEPTAYGLKILSIDGSDEA
ncbi:FliM/FliN family flagellar motor switch protein [Notoacmeibacter sp. MSK16QG-6]|uniref:FliM/FliN family flagellar motor switch protein n=1 Tax=Notoacmeibacter sp. MSK16QG-6 TaxID=2957982 RepID=UPI0020A0ECC1|nr:FliM/FliN family flagellar motor switch protein [Notoacmeibacter sp. MSK16QG-6]MCP1200906.1 FliM/FliN family flagellar motor switch protein [Notoacmeibacter sp. MSK16QG-6]